jgi:hypothetical protein
MQKDKIWFGEGSNYFGCFIGLLICSLSFSVPPWLRVKALDLKGAARPAVGAKKIIELQEPAAATAKTQTDSPHQHS